MRIRRRIVVLGLLAGLPLLIWFCQYRAFARCQKELLSAGEKLRIEELIPRPAPPGQNGAYLFGQTTGMWKQVWTNLLEKNPPEAMILVAPGKAIVGWAQPDVRYDTTNSWSEVEMALAGYGDVFDLVRKAAAFPAIDFHLNYRQGFSLPLPHLDPLRAAGQRLSAAVLCDLHDGDTAAAGTNLQTMLGLVRGTANEPLAISQLARLAMARLCVADTWEFLQSPGVSDSQLEAIQQQWTDLQFTQPAERALEMERAMGLMMAERMRSSRAEFRQVLGGYTGSGFSSSSPGEAIAREVAVGAKQVLWRLFFAYPDQLRALKGYQALLDSFRLLESGQPFNTAKAQLQIRFAQLGQLSNEESGLRMDEPDVLKLFSEAAFSLQRILNRVYYIETARELTVTALALKRYQLRHGQYPPALSALVPELLPALPLDPADGQPLRYRLKSDGAFLLYSVGENGVDDGGDAAPEKKSESVSWPHGRDVVWPSPASPEEVDAYRRYQRKLAKLRGF
jgi:hypothetical protein